jgi:predicted RNase H-like HicB family nuclease
MAFAVGSALETIISLGGASPMETLLPESIPIVLGQEDDGRWWADIESMPGVMAYGPTREAAVAAVRALALRVAADCIDHGEAVPTQFEKVFSVA